MHYYYAFRRLAGGGLRPRREGALALGGATLLLAAGLLWRQSLPGSPAHGLTWSAPRLAAVSPLAFRRPLGVNVALEGAVGLPLTVAGRQRFFDNYAAHAGVLGPPPGMEPATLAPRTHLATPTAWDGLKRDLQGYWRVIKLGFRQPMAQGGS